MIFFNELKNFKLYNRKVFLPLDLKNKRKNSLLYLITPNIDESIKAINGDTFINKYFNSYYIERDVTFLITQESLFKQLSADEYVITEGFELLNETSQSVVDNSVRYKTVLEGVTSALDDLNLDYIMDENTMTIIDNDKVTAFLEADNSAIMSSSRYNQILRQLLYRERLKTPRDIVPIYDKIKENCKDVTRTFLYLNKYKNFNMYLDFYYYNESFFKNNYVKNLKGIYLYLELLSRFVDDDRFDSYNTKHILIPVDGWARSIPEGTELTNFQQTINPVSLFSRLMRKDVETLKKTFAGKTFIFTNGRTYFKLEMDSVDSKSYTKFNRFMNILINNLPIPDEEQEADIINDSPKAIVLDILNKLEVGKTKIKINNLTGGDNITEKELLDRIENAAANSVDTDDALEQLENDNTFKELLIQLSAAQDNTVKVNDTRLKRLNNLDKELKEKTLKGIKIADMIKDDTAEELPKLDLSKRIDTVNEEDWSNLTYVNVEKSYDIDKDIVNMLHMFKDCTYPIAVRDIKVEDSSTSEDYKETYVVQCEDSFGKRFTLKFDVPKFKDGKFLIIKGNDKTINGQLLLLPISKTDPDTVQIVSNYNKIFIRRYGQKADSFTDRCIKSIEKIDSIKKVRGDCTVPNSIFSLPYTYEYFARMYNKIETSKYIMYFNQEEIRTKYNITNIPNGKIPIVYDKVSKEVQFADMGSISSYIKTLFENSSPEFNDIYESTLKGKKYMYSRASILNADIPLIVVLAYNIGLSSVLKKANVQFNILEKPSYNKKNDEYDQIRFADGVIEYKCTESANLLMNGLKEVCTDLYSIGDINSKKMWIEILDSFGNRAKLSDGLENFYDCMIDYSTKQALLYYQMPTEFTDVLLYANDLLIDTGYVDHVDMTGRRYRSNEIVAGYAYKALSKAYTEYKDKIKKGYREASMSLKQSTIIDEILMSNTSSDASYSTVVGEMEMINAVSTKGLSGMNSDRAYKIDKRSYDKSMINVLAMATNFAGNAGINRQVTIDMNIDTARGYIKIDNDTDNMSITKTFSVQEALTPLGCTRNDAMRSAMDFIQTSKHQLRTIKSFPSLITNGADQAVPYMATNNFAFKAKKKGVIKEKTNDYVIISYDDGTNDFIDIRPNIRKNSDGGFFITLKLDCDMKVGDKVKPNDIVAYDKLSFNNSIGRDDTLTYSMGLLTKVAIMSTEEGFEDSTIISQYISDALMSHIDIKKDISMDKNANLLEIAEKGQYVQEGDTILVYQDAYDEEDINILLKSLSDDVELVSELGRFTIKAKANGWIEDIKVYRTCEYEELSPSLKSLVDKIEKPIKKMRSTMKKYNIDYVYGLEPVEKLPATGKLKDVQDGIKVEIYLKYEDRMAVGDKIVDYSAVKGVVRTVWEPGMEPTSSYRPDEKIHTLLTVASTLARMCTAPIIVGSINKVLIELDRHCKDILGIKWKYLDEL